MKLLKNSMVWRIALLSLLCSVAVGCGSSGPETSPVSGKVTYKDGSPVPGGTIVFSKDNMEVTGAIKPEDGTYTLTTAKEGDGAPPGDYQVYFRQPNEASGGEPAGDGTALPGEAPLGEPAKIIEKKLFPQKYLAADTSGLTYTVKDGANENVNFPVEKPK